MSRSGAQPLRSFPGNAFQPQQPPSTQRSQALGSSRLQNGKLSNTSNWGFGVGPGVQTQQVRGSSNPSSFSQAIGAGQTQAPLDLSEFPSLSGAPQPSQQQPNSSQQSTWGTSSRVPPNAQDSHTSPFSQFGALDDYRINQSGQALSSHASEHHGSADEFPPLGGLGGMDLGNGRRNGADQSSHANGSSNGTRFPSVRTAGRNGQLGSLDYPQDASNQPGERLFSPVDAPSRAARSPFDNLDQDGVQRQDQQGGRFSRNSGQQGFISSQSGPLPYRPSQGGEHRYSQPMQESGDSIDLQLNSRTGDQSISSQMSDIDRWGIPGLIDTLRGGTSEDQAALALGMDLSTLGLDVHRPGNSPLHVDWPGPYSDPVTRPIIPEFRLPQAYTVTNVPPLHTRIGSFSDDTLFMIFYQNPRDEAQEMAAAELYKRDWRWHKKLRQWMMKAAEAPEPRVDLVRNEERGWYYFWDANSWRRERREFLLSYDHLHHPMTQDQAEAALASRG